MKHICFLFGCCNKKENMVAVAAMSVADDRQIEEILHDGNNAFTAKMFTEVAKKNPKKSFVLSAFSVLTPLAQLGLASQGESHDELLEAIGMPNDNTTKAVFSYVNTNIRNVKGVTLKTASKIYVAKGYKLNSEFSAATRNTFCSEVTNINFLENQKAADEVNTWVEQQTNNRIKNLVDPSSLDEDTRALLVNAIYFKGLWEHKFNKDLTEERDFHVDSKTVIKVPMMYRKGDYKYANIDELKSQVLEIPYEGGESSLLIILPRDIEGIANLEEKLKDPNILDKAVKDLHKVEVQVYLPKFKIETTTDLKEILENMNVKKMFDARTARLDNLLEDTSDLYVSSAIQKAFIEVNEEGAEAAAANVFEYSFNSVVLNPKTPPIFVADRPFYFVLRSNSISLFSGVVYSV